MVLFEQIYRRVFEYGAFTLALSIIDAKQSSVIFNSDKEFNILTLLLKVGTVIA